MYPVYPHRSSAAPPPPVWLTWRNWESVAVGISDLPREANTRILWEAFTKEGNIFSVDIFEDRKGNRSSRGRIRFKYVLRRSHLAATEISDSETSADCDTDPLLPETSGWTRPTL